MKTYGRILLIALFLFFIWLTNAFGQSERSIEPFDAISVTGDIEIILTPGDEPKLKIDAHNIPEDQIKIRVAAGKLRIQLINALFYKDDDVTIEVFYQNLREIKAQAGTRIRCRDTIQGDQLTINVNSGAVANLKVEVNSFEGSASEGGNLKVAGQTTTQRASAASGGMYNAFKLESARTYAKANTGGQAEIVATESLEATANTGGIVEYKGNPKERSVRTILGGTITSF